MSKFIMGDCMDYLRDYPDGFFSLAIVDPPYGDKMTRGGYMTNKVSGGVAKNRNDYNTTVFKQHRPDLDYFEELMRVSKNQVIWGGNYFADLLPSSQCWLVWDKLKPEGVHYADCELAWTSFNMGAKMYRFMWNGMLQGDMKNKEIKIHPTQKPVALYKWILSNFAEKGYKILDTHVGSASSLIACEEMGFEYVGFEINEDYYNKAKERIDEFNAQIRFDWRLP